MNLYSLVLIIIVLLAMLNMATLAWVVWLQRTLRQKEQAAAAIGRQVKVSKLAMGPKWDQMLAQVEESARQSAVESVEVASAVFKQDLATTLLKINQRFEEQTAGLVEKEFKQYQETLENLRQSTAGALDHIQTAIDAQRQALETNLESEINAQKTKLMAKFEDRIADVVSNYLTESLGNDVDLGAQSQYLFKILEENKAELRQEIMNETT